MPLTVICDQALPSFEPTLQQSLRLTNSCDETRTMYFGLQQTASFSLPPLSAHQNTCQNEFIFEPSIHSCIETRVNIEDCQVSVKRSLVNGNETVTMQTYTLDTPALDVLWTTFYIYQGRGDEFPDDHCSYHIHVPSPHQALCVVEISHLTIIFASGDVYTVRLPFDVCKVYSFSSGLLIARQPSVMNMNTESFGMSSRHDASSYSHWNLSTSNEQPFHDGRPILYTLSHPLEELHPLLIEDSQRGIRARVSPEGSELELAYREGIRPLAIFTHQKSDMLLVHDMIAECVRIAYLRQRDEKSRLRNLLNVATSTTQPRIRIRTPYNFNSSTNVPTTPTDLSFISNQPRSITRTPNALQSRTPSRTDRDGLQPVDTQDFSQNRSFSSTLTHGIATPRAVTPASRPSSRLLSDVSMRRPASITPSANLSHHQQQFTPVEFYSPWDHRNRTSRSLESTPQQASARSSAHKANTSLTGDLTQTDNDKLYPKYRLYLEECIQAGIYATNTLSTAFFVSRSGGGLSAAILLSGSNELVLVPIHQKASHRCMIIPAQSAVPIHCFSNLNQYTENSESSLIPVRLYAYRILSLLLLATNNYIDQFGLYAFFVILIC